MSLHYRTRKNLDEPKRKSHEADVRSIMSTIENTINPFELDRSEMVHVTSGVVANDSVKNDLQK